MKAYNIVLKALAAAFSTIFLIIVVTQLPGLIPFQYSPTGTAFIIVPSDGILQAISDALWNQRVVDTLAQVVLLFVAAAGAAALFRLEKPSSIESEIKEEDGQ